MTQYTPSLTAVPEIVACPICGTTFTVRAEPDMTGMEIDTATSCGCTFGTDDYRSIARQIVVRRQSAPKRRKKVTP